MPDAPRTWHYGLVARWWSEFNDGFRPHEVPYFQRLHIGIYLKNELLLMLERAGFTNVIVQGDHNDAEATSEDDFLVFVARKQ